MHESASLIFCQTCFRFLFFFLVCVCVFFFVWTDDSEGNSRKPTISFFITTIYHFRILIKLGRINGSFLRTANIMRTAKFRNHVIVSCQITWLEYEKREFWLDFIGQAIMKCIQKHTRHRKKHNIYMKKTFREPMQIWDIAVGVLCSSTFSLSIHTSFPS